MKMILLLFLCTYTLFASTDETKKKMFDFYKKENYKQACQLGYDNLEENKRDEEYVSLFAFSCLYSDDIDRLSAPAALLKMTKESRANSAYFAIIVMQKKLLYHALLDGYELSKFVLPTTDYVLSKVFDAYTKLGKHKQKKYYFFKDIDDEKITYKLYLSKDYKINKMIIEEYYDTIAIKRHEYW